MIIVKLITTVIFVISLGACSSIELEEGPGVDEIYYSNNKGNDKRIEIMRAGLTINPRFQISDPVMQIVSPPLSFPIYVRGIRSQYYQEEGRWVHEIVDPGGYINN